MKLHIASVEFATPSNLGTLMFRTLPISEGESWEFDEDSCVLAHIVEEAPVESWTYDSVEAFEEELLRFEA